MPVSRPSPCTAPRHSSVSILRARGVDDASVAAWHGHDETTMRRTYSHITRDQLAAVGQALSAPNDPCSKIM